MACDKVIQELSAFLDGELAAGETEAVRAHLEMCAGCRRELEGLRQTAGAVNELPHMPAPPDLRAKVLAGLPSGLNDGIEEKSVAPETGKTPRWRMFWGAAAALLLAALVMVLSIPAKRNPAAGRVPEVASRREAPAPMLAPVIREPGEAVQSAEEGPGAATMDESAKRAGGAVGQAEKGGAEPPATKLAEAAAASRDGHAKAAAAVSPVTETEEIALPSADPQAAFARARALAADRGWLAPEVIEAAPAEPVKAEPVTLKVLLRLKRSEVPLLKEALAKAGLGAATEARFAGKPAAAAKAAAGEDAAGGGEARKEEGLDRLRVEGQQKAPATAPAAPARAAERGTPTASMPSPQPELQDAAQGSDSIARKGLAGDALVEVILAFPRAEGATPNVPPNVKAK